MKFNVPDFSAFSNLNKIPVMPQIDFGHRDNADGFYERLTDYIINFEKELDEAHEVGARLVSFGQAITFHIEDLGYWNPSLITFSGRLDDGSPVKLIQHVSQISVLLTAVKKLNPERESIGYKLQKKREKEGTDNV